MDYHKFLFQPSQTHKVLTEFVFGQVKCTAYIFSVFAFLLVFNEMLVLDYSS